jgi:dihydrofolate reductase
MGRLIYSMMVSLDGFVETPSRSLDWVIVDEELHRFINGLARNHEMFVNGRRLYEVMRAWETLGEQPDLADYMVEFAEIWNSKPKVVFSSTLESVGPNARLIRGGEVGAQLARLKEEADGDLDVGGPMLAATAIRLGLVDEFRLFVQPVFFPRDQRLSLDLVNSRTFASGVVYLAYRPKIIDPVVARS